MSSIATAQRSRYLSPDQINLIKSTFSNPPYPSNDKIVGFIKTQFGVTYHRSSISLLRRTWGIPRSTYIRRKNPYLSEEQVKQLHVHFKNNKKPTVKSLQKAIYKLFKIEYSELYVYSLRTKWGFSKIRHQKTQPTLSKRQIKTLKKRYKGLPPPSEKEVQRFIKKKFDITLPLYTIGHRRRKWKIPSGPLTGKRKEQADGLDAPPMRTRYQRARELSFSDLFQGENPPIDLLNPDNAFSLLDEIDLIKDRAII